MFWIKKIASTLLIMFIVVTYVTISSVSIDSLMNPTQTGKTVYFLFLVLVLLLLITLLILSGYHKKINISALDALLFLWFAFIVTKSIIQQESFSLSFAEYTSLALLYVILRIIKKENFQWLFLALITGGILQAIYGNMQLWGYYPSHHNLFKLTGSFFNPGPYAGFLACVFPVALGFWLFPVRITKNCGLKIPFSMKKYLKLLQNAISNIMGLLNQKSSRHQDTVSGKQFTVFKYIGKYMPVVALLSIILVLPASRSRAAWLAVAATTVYLFAIKYKWIQKFKELNFSVKKKALMIAMIIAIMFAGAIGLYRLKKGSADGRVLIWKVTLNIIADHPLTGTGFNGFKAHYMDYQADYFRQNPDSNEAMVAGDTNYAFNELLQQTVAHGLTGTILLVVVFITAFSVKPVIKSNSNSKNKSDSRATCHVISLSNMPTSHAITYSKMQTVVLSKAILLSFVIFSLFSYPVQILPIKTGIVLALACLAGNSRKLNFYWPANKMNRPLTISIAKTLIGGAAIAAIYFGAGFLDKQTTALKDWKYAFTLYGMGAYEQSVAEYEKALPVLQHNGDFLTNYGKTLSMAGKYKKAVNVLQQAAKHYPNIVVYTALGDSYKATGKNKKSEAAYLHAWHMNPARFYPKYLLAKLYDKTGQRTKAVKIAKELLEKKIKVESTAIEEIKAEMRKIIDK